MKQLIFEEITEAHIGDVREIYNYYVKNTTISFDIDGADIEQMKASVMNDNPRFKSFVIFEDKSLKGYALLTQYKKKHAYDITAEVTIYLKPDCLGEGIGGQTLRFLEEQAREQGFKTLIATICTENERSIALFEKHGYVQRALFKEIAYKFDRGLDIVCHQKML